MKSLLNDATELERSLKMMKKWLLLERKNWFLEKDLLSFFKKANGCKFAVEHNWTNKISQNIGNLGFSIEKTNGFSEKLVKFF